MKARRAGAGRVSEGIARRIREAISRGRLVPGRRLPSERKQAQRLSASRLSVREAYRSLEESGLIAIRRGAEGGAFIADIGHEPVSRSLALMLRLGKTSLEELTEARLLLEPPVARLAARRADPQDIEQLTLLLRKQEDALEGGDDPRRYDLQFHRLVAQCAKNLPLTIVMNSVADLTVEAISGLELSIEIQRQTLFFHRRIFHAIRRKDEAAAERIMLRHVVEVQSRLGSSLASQMGSRRSRPVSGRSSRR